MSDELIDAMQGSVIEQILAEKERDPHVCGHCVSLGAILYSTTIAQHRFDTADTPESREEWKVQLDEIRRQRVMLGYHKARQSASPV